MKTTIATLSALAIATTFSLAQDKPPGPPKGPGGPDKRPPPEEIFKKLDTNNDGKLSPEEFKASPIGKKDEAKAAEVFKKMDTDADGFVSLEEFKAHHKDHKPGGGKGGPGPGKGHKAPPAPTTPPAGQ